MLFFLTFSFSPTFSISQYLPLNLCIFLTFSILCLLFGLFLFLFFFLPFLSLSLFSCFFLIFLHAQTQKLNSNLFLSLCFANSLYFSLLWHKDAHTWESKKYNRTLTPAFPQTQSFFPGSFYLCSRPSFQQKLTLIHGNNMPGKPTQCSIG